MKKVIITGASGFIGKALTKYLLDKDITVFALVRNAQKLAEFSSYSNINIITCSMDEYKNLAQKITERDFDACFHIAWEGLDSTYYNRSEVQIGNIQKSVDLIDALKDIGIKKLLFANSSFQYKYFTTDFEDYNLTSNVDIYGIIKQATGNLLQKKSLEYAIDYYSIIIPVAYGVGDYSKRSTNMLINMLQNNNTPKLVDSEMLLDWVYIDDVILIIYNVIERGKPFKNYYVGYRKVKTFGEIIRMVGKVVNPNIELNFGTYHDNSFIDYSKFLNDDLYLDTGFEITSNFEKNIKKTAEWVKTLNL